MAPGNGETLQARVAVTASRVGDMQRAHAATAAGDLVVGIFHSWHILLTKVAAHPSLHQCALANARGAEDHHAEIFVFLLGHDSTNDQQSGQRSKPLHQLFLEAKAGVAHGRELARRCVHNYSDTERAVGEA